MEVAEIHVFGGNIILVATRDVLSFALVYADSFPAESTCVTHWSAQCELCRFVRHSVELCGCCCSAQCVLRESRLAHQVLVLLSLVDASAHLVHEIVFLPRDMACTMAQENLMCPSYPAWWRSMSRRTAQRKIKDKKEMSHFEKFVTESNEKGDELAKEGAMLDEGFMVEAQAETMQQEREVVYGALQHVASFFCLVEQWKDCEELRPKPKEQWFFVDKKSGSMKHGTEWCVETKEVSMYEMWKRKQI